LSPVQPTHASPAPQIGVVIAHAAAFVDVHCTHVFVAGSQAGVGAVQFESLAHTSHLPVLAPVEMQRPAVHWSVVAHVPSPRLMPQRLPVVSHAPLRHARTPLATVHVPFTGGTPGTG
jgi:hypothetical protein